LYPIRYECSTFKQLNYSIDGCPILPIEPPEQGSPPVSIGWGNPGDVKAVGEGVSEMRIDTGPGYRVYYKQTGRTIILILCGGDKSSQHKDIKKAKRIAAGL
jgi:NADPH:quinone reductase-like Zn-dependent oxidoreductase